MIEVGQLVQVEISGAYCLPEPAVVVDMIDHAGDTYVFVEGSTSGVLLSNIVEWGIDGRRLGTSDVDQRQR